MGPLTVFEGPDCSGKSTLAYTLRQRRDGYRLIHHGPYPQVKRMLPRLYVETMLPLLMNMEKGQVWDRSWLSEPIYGQAFRHGEDRVGIVARRHLERFALRHGGIVVLCLPPYELVAEKWQERQGDEYLEKEEQLRQVYDGYAALCTHLPVVVYDYTRHSPDVLLQEIEMARPRIHPRWHVHTGGSWRARIVLVGESMSELRDEDCAWRVPFGSFSSQGCSAWLTAELERVGVREDQLLWVNADEDVTWLAERHNELVVALGKQAAAKLTEHKIAHVEQPHPQYWKRFQASEPYPLLDLLTTHLGAPHVR